MDAVFYWDMTYKEIVTAIEANQRQKKESLQVRASFIFNLGSLIGCAVNSPQKYPSLSNAFPGLFEESKPAQQNWQLMKERIESYAAERRKRGENTNVNNA